MGMQSIFTGLLGGASEMVCMRNTQVSFKGPHVPLAEPSPNFYLYQGLEKTLKNPETGVASSSSYSAHILNKGS